MVVSVASGRLVGAGRRTSTDGVPDGRDPPCGDRSSSPCTVSSRACNSVMHSGLDNGCGTLARVFVGVGCQTLVVAAGRSGRMFHVKRETRCVAVGTSGAYSPTRCARRRFACDHPPCCATVGEVTPDTVTGDHWSHRCFRLFNVTSTARVMTVEADLAIRIVLLVVMVGSGILLVWMARAAASGRLKRNSMAGIRIPSTMASDEAWLAAHVRAKRVTTLAGLSSVVSGLVALLPVSAPVLAGAVLTGCGLVLAFVLYGARVGGKRPPRWRLVQKAEPLRMPQACDAPYEPRRHSFLWVFRGGPP